MQAVTYIIVLIMLGALRAVVFQFLWNMLIVSMFGAPALTFWPAWGILLVANMLTAGGVSIDPKRKDS